MSLLPDLLSSRVKAEIFRLLFGLDPCELHVREIARRSRLNDATVRQELRRLTRLGVIIRRRDGNRVYYSAASEHPIYPDLRNLVLKTSGLAEVLREKLQGSGIRVAFVFGSLAKGQERAASDVDLMVIGSISPYDLAGRTAGTALILGREINPHVLTAAEFTRRRRKRDHFLGSVLAAPKLFLIGDERDLEGLGG